MDKRDIFPDQAQASLLTRRLLDILADLAKTPDGAVLFDHARQVLHEQESMHSNIEQTYAEFIKLILDACAAHLSSQSPFLTHLRLVQKRLTPPISLMELGILRQCVESAAKGLRETSELREEDVIAGLSETLRGFNFQAQQQPPADNPSIRDPQVQAIVQAAQAGEGYRADEMAELQADFVKHIRAAVVQCEAFGELLEAETEALQEAENAQEVAESKASMTESLEALAEGQYLLMQQFDLAQDYLTLLETDHRQLSAELERVRMLSLTDELTALPNRRAFIRRLDDEVSRVRRYGYPLTLALLDLDYFKDINDRYGHAGGDAVLKLYADKVLSIFRHHDMVARYGGEEFAVILPNTSVDGVLKALAKVKSKVQEAECMVNATQIPVPTFSAGLAEYKVGETPTHLVERADSALYRAKRMGRNRIQIHALDSETLTPS